VVKKGVFDWLGPGETPALRQAEVPQETTQEAGHPPGF